MRYPSLAQHDLVDTLRLFRTKGIGAVGFFKQLAHAGSPEAALALLSKDKPIASEKEVKEELKHITKIGARILRYGDDDYPNALLELYDAPPLLTTLGDPGWFNNTPLISIVGARHASKAGEKLAYQIAQALCDVGYAVISGLARGIDGAAHRGALQAGGLTAGISAVGIDQIYPQQHHDLYQLMASKGCILTEYAPGTPPNPRHFPARNRIIAGMSQATIVIEASMRFGSRITARYAADYGRDVLAVPGAPGDARSRGCNLLIKEGAALVDCVDDVLDELHALPNPIQAEHSALEPTQQLPQRLPHSDILSALSKTPITLDELCQHVGLDAASLAPLLLEHELMGDIVRHAGNKVSLA